MRLDVLGEVVRTHEALVADGAGKTLLARVRAQVPLKLVGAGEPLPTEEPIADKWPLTGVPAEMRLQMGGFAVHLAAARNVAGVNVSLAQVLSRRSEALSLLAVWTVAGCPACVSPL